MNEIFLVIGQKFIRGGGDLAKHSFKKRKIFWYIKVTVHGNLKFLF